MSTAWSMPLRSISKFSVSTGSYQSSDAWQWVSTTTIRLRFARGLARRRRVNFRQVRPVEVQKSLEGAEASHVAGTRAHQLHRPPAIGRRCCEVDAGGDSIRF